MKNQYVGDFNHFRVFRFLKAFSHYRFEIGICQMVTEDDRRSYQLGARESDPDLFDALQRISTSNQRIIDIHNAKPIPDAIYFAEAVPAASEIRVAYFQRALSVLSGADLVLFEPDRGLDLDNGKDRNYREEWVFPDEVELFIREGVSVAFPVDQSNSQDCSSAIDQWLSSCDGIESVKTIVATNCSLVVGIHRALSKEVGSRWNDILLRSGWAEKTNPARPAAIREAGQPGRHY